VISSKKQVGTFIAKIESPIMCNNCSLFLINTEVEREAFKMYSKCHELYWTRELVIYLSHNCAVLLASRIGLEWISQLDLAFN
jgi:hypothetical protein